MISEVSSQDIPAMVATVNCDECSKPAAQYAIANEAVVDNRPTMRKMVAEAPAIRMEPEKRFEVSFKEANIKAQGNVSVVPNGGTRFNVPPYAGDPYATSWVMHYPGSSRIDLNTFMTKADAGKDWSLNLSHLSSTVNGKGFAPIDVIVNGEKVASHFVPIGDHWHLDSFKVSRDLLKEGYNEISIQFCQDAWSNYWINRLDFTVAQ